MDWDRAAIALLVTAVVMLVGIAGMLLEDSGDEEPPIFLLPIFKRTDLLFQFPNLFG